MSQFHITFENTEDTFDSTDSLEEAKRIAREVAKNGQVNGAVCIEHDGLDIWQFVLMPNGSVNEAQLS